MTLHESTVSRVEATNGLSEREVNVSAQVRDIITVATSALNLKSFVYQDRTYFETSDILVGLLKCRGPFQRTLRSLDIHPENLLLAVSRYNRENKEIKATRIPDCGIFLRGVSTRVEKLLDNTIALAGERPGSKITLEVADLEKVFIVQERHGILASRWIGTDVSSQEFWKRLNLD